MGRNCRHIWISVMAMCWFAGVLGVVFSAAATPEITRQTYSDGGSKAYLPQVAGSADPIKEGVVNKSLKKAILSLAVKHPETSLHGDFEVGFNNGRLLGVRFFGDSTFPRMLHPNKIDQGIHIDLETGKVYSLADLFRPGVDYTAKIIELCGQNKQDMRLEIEGLWNGWTHDDFTGSWSGADRAFVFQLNSLRVYSIPRYATGAISGYQINYSDLMEIIDQNGDLWKSLRNNVIDRSRIQLGDSVAGLKVISLHKAAGYLNDVSFVGKIELNGISEWVENTGDGPGYLFTVDPPDRYRLPSLGIGNEKRVIVLRMSEAYKSSLPKEKTKVHLVIDQFSIGERQIETTAKLVAATVR